MGESLCDGWYVVKFYVMVECEVSCDGRYLVRVLCDGWYVVRVLCDGWYVVRVLCEGRYVVKFYMMGGMWEEFM